MIDNEGLPLYSYAEEYTYLLIIIRLADKN